MDINGNEVVCPPQPMRVRYYERKEGDKTVYLSSRVCFCCTDMGVAWKGAVFFGDKRVPREENTDPDVNMFNVILAPDGGIESLDLVNITKCPFCAQPIERIKL